MIRLFRSLQPATLFALPIIGLALWLPGFFKNDMLRIDGSGVLSNLLTSWLTSIPNTWLTVFAAALVIGEAIYLNYVLNRHEVLYKGTYLPALMYVILMSFNYEIITFHVILLVNLCLIFMCDRFFSLFKKENATALIFDCGFMIAVISMFYLPFVSLLLFMVIVLIVMRPFSIREWFIAIIGFMLPYFFLAVYYFVTDRLQIKLAFLLDQRIFGFPRRINLFFHREAAYFLFICYLLIMIFISLVRLRANFYKNSIKTRSAQQVLIILFILLVVEAFCLQRTPLEYFLQLAVPFSVFLAYFYSTVQKRLWIYEVSFLIFLALIVKSYF